MKKQYDFRSGRRGPVLRTPPGKTRITIRIDDDILQWFRAQVHKAGGGSYQTLINEALRSAVGSAEKSIEDTLRRVLREELPRYRVSRKTALARRCREGRGRPRPEAARSAGYGGPPREA
jgi:Arc/MetJ family transcription regulator